MNKNTVKKKIAVLSNITVDLIRIKLSGMYDVYVPEGFNAWISEVLNPAARLYTEEIDAVVLLLDGKVAADWRDFAEMEENLNLWKQGVVALAENITQIPIFISTVDFRTNRIRALAERQYRIFLQNEWYQFAQEMSEKSDHVYVFDLADVIAEVGRNNFYSDKMWYMGSMPYSRDGVRIVCEVIRNLMNSAFSERKKIIALDLDNTLWGGVAGEDGIDGIELSDHKEGQRFFDFQRQFLEMQERGVVLTLVSKNNSEDVQPILEKHPFMLLREDKFVSSKINWNGKPQNLKEIGAELNLTEGSFVFIDDNPAEREAVRAGCPQMEVVDFPEDTTQLAGFAEKLYYEEFRPLRVLKEDLDKTKMYQSEALRRQDALESLNLESYLKKLKMRADIHRMRDEELDRVVQLCNKTNQFNLTTKRYSGNDILKIASKPENVIYVVYLSDQYGDSGLVGVVILLGSGQKMIIDTFLMSCRVMGRKLEDVIINELLEYYRPRVSFFTARFVPTSKNVPVADLYDRLGFELKFEKNGEKEYQIMLNNYQHRDFPYYKEISFDAERSTDDSGRKTNED